MKKLISLFFICFGLHVFGSEVIQGQIDALSSLISCDSESFFARIEKQEANLLALKSVAFIAQQEKQTSLNFIYQAINVREKTLRDEENLDANQSACARQTVDAFLLLETVPEYKKILTSKKIKTIQVELFDVRNSCHENHSFAIGGMEFKKYANTNSKPIYQLRTCDRYVYGVCELWPKKWDAATEHEVRYTFADSSRHQVRAIYPQASNDILKVSAVLNSYGECIDPLKELIAELDAQVFPEQYKALKLPALKKGINQELKSKSIKEK